MAQYANSAEGGSSGTTVTTGNSGGASGDAWTAVTIAGGDGLTFDNTHAAHGNLAYKIVATTGATFFERTYPGATTTVALRFYLYIAANPSSLVTLANFTSSGTVRCMVNITAAGKLQFQSASGVATLMGTVTPTGQWVRVELTATLNAVTGSMTLKRFDNPDSNTVGDSITASGQNLGGSADRYRIGRLGFSTGSFSGGHWIDEIAANDTGVAIGPLAAERSLTDSITVSDSTARGVADQRALSDTITVSDSLARAAATESRTAADTITVSDTAAGRTADSRQVADTITVTDATTSGTADPRPASDTLTVSDAITAGVDQGRDLPDTISVSDSLDRAAVDGRTLGDLITVTDATLTQLATARALADLITVTDGLVWNVPAGPTPAERRYLIGADPRLIPVATERRFVTVGADRRLVTVAAENRQLSVPFEDRTVREA